MKQQLQIKMGQQLAMTPQLQQAIKLLQLSTLELQTEIQAALDSNPMLERLEEEGEDKSADGADESERREQNRKEQEARAEDNTDSDKLDKTNADNLEADATYEFTSESPDVMPEDLPVDSAWEDVYESASVTPMSGSADTDQRDFTEFHNTGHVSIQDYLYEQIRLSHMSERDLTIAESIIDAVDDNGYLTESVEDLLSGLNRQTADPEDAIDEDEIETVLHMVQQLDPVGCGARTISECMFRQLSQHEDSEIVEKARILVRDHLELLASHDFPKLRRLLKINDEKLREIIALVRSLNPRPGRQIVSDHNQYIVPDVFVKKVKGVWRVELNPDIAPRLGINSLYAGMVKRADKSDDNNFLRNHLQEARWFIKSLQSRNETLLRVGTAIVERQRNFLEYGEEAMKPLVLRDIAEQLDLHESTISRVTTQKYIHTPRGIFEFKYFFSSHVSTDSGGECSATAIRAKIRRYINAEDTSKPLSDSKIATTLVNEGIQVARRTVAKYRESMAIPPSNERKRLN